MKKSIPAPNNDMTHKERHDVARAILKAAGAEIRYDKIYYTSLSLKACRAADYMVNHLNYRLVKQVPTVGGRYAKNSR